MPDWPKHHLERAETVRLELDGHTYESDGATFVRCLESGGWKGGEREPAPTRKWTVQVKKTLYGDIDVEASSAEEACQKADQDYGGGVTWGETQFDVVDAFEYTEEKT